MSDIKRYNLHGKDSYGCDEFQHPDGAYVRWTDHCAELSDLKACQGGAWKCLGCGATSGSSCNANGCFENERCAPPATGVIVPPEWCDMLEELQWQHRDADDHYHKPAGFYCPNCCASQEEGHARSCSIRALLAQAKP